MNQRISAAQLQQLNDSQKDILRNQWTPQEGEYVALGDHEEMIYYLNGIQKSKTLPLLTIGQMIAYLHQQDSTVTMQFTQGEWLVTSSRTSIQRSQLCEALWDTMITVL